MLRKNTEKIIKIKEQEDIINVDDEEENVIEEIIWICSLFEEIVMYYWFLVQLIWMCMLFIWFIS